MKEKPYYHIAQKFEFNTETCELEGRWFAYKRKRKDPEVNLGETDDGVYGSYDNGFYVAAWDLEDAKRIAKEFLQIQCELIQKTISELNEVTADNIQEEDDGLVDFSNEIVDTPDGMI